MLAQPAAEALAYPAAPRRPRIAAEAVAECCYIARPLRSEHACPHTSVRNPCLSNDCPDKKSIVDLRLSKIIHYRVYQKNRDGRFAEPVPRGRILA